MVGTGEYTDMNGDTKPVIVEPKDWKWPSTILVSAIAFAFWIGGHMTDINKGIEEIPLMRNDISTALHVLTDHGSELDKMRGRIGGLENGHNDIQRRMYWESWLKDAEDDLDDRLDKLKEGAE